MSRARLRTAGLALVVASCTAGCGRDRAPEGVVPAVARGERAPTAGDVSAQPPGHQRMLELLREVERRTPDEHHYLGDRRARELRAALRVYGDSAPAQLWVDAAVAELQLGRERAAIELLETAERGLRNGTIPGDATAAMTVQFQLGVASMRLAETQNCCELPSPDSCILPIRGGGLHTRPEGASAAIRHFLAVLDMTREDDYWHLAARWLLNLAHMTLGSWPDGVPEAHRLPAERLTVAADADFPRFVNVAAGRGLDTFSLSGGAVADDFDGDDDLDLVVSTWDTSGQLRFWVNQGDGTFADRTAAAGLTGLLGGLNLVQADYDGDGDVDFLVLRGAWLFEHGRYPNSLVRNNGDGTFTDVTFDAGLGAVHYPTQTAGWADFDNDGDLDLYVGNESPQNLRHPCQLFRNDGDGTFTDVAARAGVENLRYTKAVAWGDYDDDGFPDLYVSNIGSENRLFHNQRDGTFVDVAPRLGVTQPLAGFPAWFWDYDNDGDLDLFASSYDTGIGHLAAWHLGMPVTCGFARLYRNDGAGRFTDVAEQSGLHVPAMPMGSNYGDLDGDGWLDMYLGTGDPSYYSLMPNLMFVNRGGRGFVDVTLAGGFGHLQKGHAVVFADLDADGDVDVFEQMGGAYRGDGFRDALYENPGFGNRWLCVHAVGVRSNRAAIGARIRVDVVEDGAERAIHRLVSSGGSFGGNPLRQTIGLGAAERIVRVAIAWPTTGVVQTIEGVPLDSAIRVVEDTEGFTPIALRPGRR
ncbi:MAG: CRTAC1 family protein [Planctomycetes bacterium]|nr:CRTAC1 family protein [Planctomycetota bacterium]